MESCKRAAFYATTAECETGAGNGVETSNLVSLLLEAYSDGQVERTELGAWGPPAAGAPFLRRTDLPGKLTAMDAADLMRVAIEKCREGVAAGQTPFGCAIARDGELLACSHNTVLASVDITAHAEVNALRAACQAVDDIFLTGAVVATTCEPCPMCMAALHWARVETVYYGASIADAGQAGFNELTIPAADLLRIGGSPLELVPDVLRDECCQLMVDWNENPNRKAY